MKRTISRSPSPARRHSVLGVDRSSSFPNRQVSTDNGVFPADSPESLKYDRGRDLRERQEKWGTHVTTRTSVPQPGTCKCRIKRYKHLPGRENIDGGYCPSRWYPWAGWTSTTGSTSVLDANLCAECSTHQAGGGSGGGSRRMKKSM